MQTPAVGTNALFTPPVRSERLTLQRISTQAHYEELTVAIHSLTNLSADHFIDLPVEVDEDVMTVARQTLFDSGLSEEVQQGFFVSVFPTDDGLAG